MLDFIEEVYSKVKEIKCYEIRNGYLLEKNKNFIITWKKLFNNLCPKYF